MIPSAITSRLTVSTKRHPLALQIRLLLTIVHIYELYLLTYLLIQTLLIFWLFYHTMYCQLSALFDHHKYDDFGTVYTFIYSTLYYLVVCKHLIFC